MKTPLAWHNLVHNRMRTAVATAGVAFSVLLIFMQWGFLGSVQTTATMIYESLDFDLAIRSKEYLHIAKPRSFSQSRLYQANAVEGVESAAPFYVGMNQWRNPSQGTRHPLLVIGVDPKKPVFENEAIGDGTKLLVRDSAVLMDRECRSDFGPKEGEEFSDADEGVESEIGVKRVDIVGCFRLGSGLTADGAAIVNADGFCRLYPGRTKDRVSLGLLKVSPGADSNVVAEQLTAILPADVEVLPRERVIDLETDRWVNDTPIGIIFQLGVGVAFVVGLAIVYQVLSADVASHLSEYATLKAMGYSQTYLSSVVLTQACALAIIGFVPGLVSAYVLYWITGHIANIPMIMTTNRVGLVLGLAIAMCVISGMGALQKSRSADPADLF